MRIKDEINISYNEFRKFKLIKSAMKEIKDLSGRAKEIVKIDSCGIILRNIDKKEFHIMITFLHPTSYSVDLSFFTDDNLIGTSIESIETKNYKNYLELYHYFLNEVKEC